VCEGRIGAKEKVAAPKRYEDAQFYPPGRLVETVKRKEGTCKSQCAVGLEGAGSRRQNHVRRKQARGKRNELSSAWNKQTRNSRGKKGNRGKCK